MTRFLPARFRKEGGAPSGAGEQLPPRLPRHVAIIMDGNGRWAQRRFLPRAEGHRRGVRSVRRVIEAAAQSGVRYLSLFAFSSENWKRPADEVNALMGLFATALKKEAQAMTAHGETMTLTICANYGGRWDIVEAFRNILRKDPSIAQEPERVTEALVDANLAFDWAPPVDLMIRTGGEQRISLWPDFDENDLKEALDWYAGRERRFGMTGEQIKALGHGE